MRVRDNIMFKNLDVILPRRVMVEKPIYLHVIYIYEVKILFTYSCTNNANNKKTNGKRKINIIYIDICTNI